MSNVDCKKWHYLEPLNQNKIEKNFFSFSNLLKSFGSEIYYLDQQDKYYDSVFLTTHHLSLNMEQSF